MKIRQIQGRAGSPLRAAGPWRPTLHTLALGCIGLGFGAVSLELFEVVRAMLSPNLAPRSATRISAAHSSSDKIDLRVIAAANLFGSQAAVDSREPPAERRDLVLSGIMFFSGKDEFSRIMLAEYPKTSFAVGDRVTGDVVVSAILPRSAIVVDGGGPRILRLHWDRRAPGATVAATSTGEGDLRASGDDTAAPPPVEPYVDPVGDG